MYIEHSETRCLAHATSVNGQRPGEQRTVVHERMIFAALTARVNARLLKLAHQRLIHLGTEPCRSGAGQFDAGEQSFVATGEVCAHKLSGRFAPERLTMDESRSCSALFIPGAHVGEMNVAE